MKILVVSQYFWPENFRINELVGELVRRGHQVVVLTGQPNYPDGVIFPEYRAAPARYSAFEGAEIVRTPMLPRGRGRLRLLLNYVSFALLAGIWGSWKLRGRAFDVIFTFEPSPISVGIASAWMRWRTGARQAFWVLDLWPETLRAVNMVRSDRLLSFVGLLVRFVYRHCDLILAQSRSFVGDIGRYAPQDAWIEYFPAWADQVFAAGRAAPAAEIPPASAGMTTILFAGNIGEAQDFPAILEAAGHLRHRSDIRWVVVGDGRMAGWLREQIAERQLEQAVLMVGRHPLERMPAFYAHADALLVSLKDDPVFAMTIPGKLQSYFAAGLPVLAMLNGEGARIVAEGQAGLVCPAGNGRQLAEIVERMADMPPEARQRMGENGRHLCAEQFDRGLLISRLEGWLTTLAAKRKENGKAGAAGPM